MSVYTLKAAQMMRLLDPNIRGDFLQFGLRFLSSMVSTIVKLVLVTWLLTMFCHTHYFSHPYLVSKLVEFLFMVNSEVQEKT